MPNLLKTKFTSVNKSSDLNRGRHRLKIECATCKTPLLTMALSGVRRETRSCGMHSERGKCLGPGRASEAYINKSFPALPKVAVRYDTNGVPKLGLDPGRRGGHEPNELLLNSTHLAAGELVVSIFVLQPHQLRFPGPRRGLWGRRTVQLRLMRFLKHRALASRVV